MICGSWRSADEGDDAARHGSGRGGRSPSTRFRAQIVANPSSVRLSLELVLWSTPASSVIAKATNRPAAEWRDSPPIQQRLDESGRLRL